MNNYRYRCIATTPCGSTSSNAGILTVNDIPVITTHPQNATLCSGSNNTFCVTATGNNLIYQWQSSPLCSGPWTNIAGATSSCLTITGVTTNTAYKCIVSNTCAAAVSSNCAIVTVVTSVSITLQPTNVTACVGSNASFTVAGSGSGIIYQWQLSTDGGTTYNNISGANAATFTVTSVTAAMNGYKYRCQLSNPTCTTPGISNAATLTVNSLPAITTNPQDASICTGGNNTFSVIANGTGITYQWQLSTDGGITYTTISGATSAVYIITGATAGMNGNRYRCVVSGACTPATTSSAAILTVISPVTITNQPGNAEVCSGSNVNFIVAGSGSGIIYQWQLSTDGGTTWNNITGGTSSTLSLTSVTTALTGNRYRCQIWNATCTTPATSGVAILTVRQLPTLGLSASPLTSLLPGQTTTLTATPSASTGGTLTTSWFKNTAAFTNTGNSYAVNVETIGSYQVRIQEAFGSGVVCSNQSAVLVIDAAVSSQLFIFPSPNDGQFIVSYYNNGGNSTSRTVTVYDSKGAKTYNAKFPVTGPYTLLGIDIRPALTGVYYVVVGDIAGNKLAEGKVLVH